MDRNASRTLVTKWLNASLSLERLITLRLINWLVWELFKSYTWKLIYKYCYWA